MGSQPCMRRTRNQAVFIPEIERFLHRRRRAAQNNTAMANRTLKEYATPSTAEPQAVIVYPTVEDDNFEIKPALLNLVQQNQFSGSPTEDPNLHISVFLRISGTMKENQEAVRLHLFPFSLRDRASAWFHSLEVGSITSWDQMRQAFLARFFPPSKTAKLRDQITRFNQKDGESLYEAWERFKEMLRLCPHHGLEKWLIVHTFYNGLSYTTKMSVDAAAGGALMNKNYTEAYALIEDMAQNHYKWTDERAITSSSSSKKEAGMYEVSNYDHLASKIDTLTEKLEKLNVSAINSASTPSCEICGITGHAGVDCQLGSAINGVEQMNYAQYNQGMRQNQNFYKNQNPYGQVAPPGYANNQRFTQKSNLEILLENSIANQNKQLQELKNQTGFLNDSLSKLNTKVDSIATHSKMLETQIAQIAQQVATSSQTPGVFPGQTEANPKAQVNVISFGGSKLGETFAKVKNIGKENVKPLGDKVVIEEAKPLEENKTPSPLNPEKLKLEGKFEKFVNILRKICIKLPFAEALSRMPLYAKFLKEIFSKKRAIEHNETIALAKETSAIIQEAPPKLRDPGSFAIPCEIGNETINKALCDLGASVSLLPLSLLKRIGIGELKPTEMELKIADRSTMKLVGFVEDIPVKIEGIYIPTDFVVVDIEEDDDVPIILGRPFLATAGALIDVKLGRIVFQVSDKMVGFELENVMKGPALYSCCMLNDHVVKERFIASSTQYDIFDPF